MVACMSVFRCATVIKRFSEKVFSVAADRRLAVYGSVSQSVFCGTSTYCVLNTVPPIEDDHGNSNSSHVKIFLPKKLLECLPKCSSLPKERHRWNTNERS
nr:calmodulin-binding transcription activator 1-like [Aotus nancymaae]